MHKYRRLHRRRAVSFLVDWLVILLFLTVWIVARKPAPSGRLTSIGFLG